MKKITFLLIILLLPVKVFAYSNDYDVNSYDVSLNILDNGSLKIEEKIKVFGNSKSFVKEIYYKNSRFIANEPVSFSEDAIYNGTSIKDVTLKVEKGGELTSEESKLKKETIELSKAFYDDEAVSGHYTEKSLQDGKSYKIYYDVSNENITYIIDYTITDAVVLHEDIAELYWSFLNTSFADSIENMDINVSLPGSDNSKYFRVWTHGKTSSKINYLDSKNFNLHYTQYTRATPIEFRVTFNKNLITNITALKRSHTYAFEAISSLEENEQKAIDEQNQSYLKRKKIFDTITFVYYLIVFAWWLWIFKRYNIDNMEECTKGPIDFSFNPTDILDAEYIINKDISDKILVIIFMNLIQKRNISYRSLSNNDFSFTFNNKKSINLREEALIEFLFERVGNNNTFTLKQLSDYKNSPRTKAAYEKFYQDFILWCKKDCQKNDYYENNGLPVVFSIFYLLIGIFITLASVYFEYFTFFVFGTLVISILLLFYSLQIKKRTKKGKEAYTKLITIKNNILVFWNNKKIAKNKLLLYAFALDKSDALPDNNKDITIEKNMYLAFLGVIKNNSI